MARIRTIKPEFCTSEQIVECSPIARLLFVELWLFCDDAGRHPLSWKRIKMECFPGDDLTSNDVKGMVCELWSADLISCYEYRGKPYLQVNTWEKHQKIDRPSYRFGPLDQDGNPVEFDEDSTIDPRTIVERSTTAIPRNGMESNGREGISIVREYSNSPNSPDGEVGQDPPKKPKRQRRTYPKEFSEWYQTYPKREAKREAEKAYYRAVAVVAKSRECSDEAAHAILRDAARCYAATRTGQDPKYTKYPATWLNQGCWDDEQLVQQRPSRVATAEDLASWRP